MSKYGLYLLVLVSVIVVSITTIPAYAEVTSLQTTSSFYKGGSTIYFSGTVLNTDPPNVTILVFDPTDKFILLASGNADSNHQFQISVDTSTSDNQQKFLLKGTYNATAFIANKENGKTVNFVFSPDGSPVLPSSPTSLTASVISATEIDLNWVAPANAGGTQSQGYKVERSADAGSTWLATVGAITSTTFSDTGLTPNTSYMYRVSAVNQAGASAPSVITTAVTLSSPGQTTTQQTTNQSSTLTLDQLLQQRLEEAQKLQELLHGGNPSSPSAPSGNAQTIRLSENMAVTDASSSLGVQSANVSGNNSTLHGIVNFDTSLVMYPVMSLVGVGIVVYILYLRKKRKPLSDDAISAKKTAFTPSDVPSDQNDAGDHAMMILKNRLAKGEITVDEFKALKDELSEL